VSGYVSCNTPLQRLDNQSPPATTTSSLTFQEAQAASLKLEPGLTKDDVVKILGTPTNTELRAMAEATATPWQALVWNFVWNDGAGNRTLSIIFGEHEGWHVKSWTWF
jgi:hypothetical protein